MRVIITSQCTKNALVESRRILDQFAERFGNRVWHTHITEQGLNALRKILKQTARKNTAIACHYIHGRASEELLWIVGDAKRFNDDGLVPTNSTKKNILRNEDEDNWQTLTDIQILTAIAALFHDFGKANAMFQSLLKKRNKTTQPFRHEWLSLRLFQAYVGDKSDEEWLKTLSEGSLEKNENYFNRLRSADLEENNLIKPFDLPPIAKSIAWLILSHHRLPVTKNSIKAKMLNDVLPHMSASWNHNPTFHNENESDIDKMKKACWTFKKGLPFESRTWLNRARYWANIALERKQFFNKNWIDDVYSLHLARMSLMLADHYYSSQPQNYVLGDHEFPLYANTDKEGKLKQRLDEHLLGVEQNANKIVKALPTLFQTLPKIALNREFSKRSKAPEYQWQDQAYDLACSLRNRTRKEGFFGVNMASTGCGKTLANGRIMYGLAEPKLGARFSIALGLRTLTLQTGEAYRERLKLDTDDLAVLVGSKEARELFDLNSLSKNHQEEMYYCGSESNVSLVSENEHVIFEGTNLRGPLKHYLSNDLNAKKLISAPILICTIDHLIGATESTRGGKQILPMLRLMTSDLVLDEPDDFDIRDLSALTRLVHWSGLLGSRVLLSSATLPPSLIGGLFEAYKEGRASFRKGRNISDNDPGVCCAWFDEFRINESTHFSYDDYLNEHQKFIDKRVKNIQKKEIKRKAEIKSLNILCRDKNNIAVEVAASMNKMMHELHKFNHVIDPQTGKKVSFGLIRMANIDPLIDAAEALFTQGAQDDYQIRLCCYHSRHPLIVRSNLENKLDRVLKRHKEQEIFDDLEIRHEIDSYKENNIIFVVLATPVAEVGRDHDYDWAIVEPSSMRSIIQLAGRIKRHRSHFAINSNIFLLETNIKSLKKPGSISYCYPGFEKKSEKFQLISHNLNHILTEDQYKNITSIPRIIESSNLMPNENLVDLEHGRLKVLMLTDETDDEWPVNLWWKTKAHLTGILQYMSPFRDNHDNEVRFYLLPDDELKEINFFSDNNDNSIKQNYQFQFKSEITLGPRIHHWGKLEYVQELISHAEKWSIDPKMCAEKFGWVELPIEDNTLSWQYNHILGFRRKR